jgi:tRNA-specific 2-thiouridylase
LYRIREEDLARTLFPIGDIPKSQVRGRAQSFGLPVAQKPDSQGLCFVGDVSMRDFLARYITLTPGKVLDTAGRTIGGHEGTPLYTIGQRHGFTTDGEVAHEGGQYVISVSIPDNTITVSSDRMLGEVKEVTLRDVHWIGDEPDLPLKTVAQSRYREKPFSVTVTRVQNQILVVFEEPHLVSSGQSLVLYDGDYVIGGGVIDRHN